MNQLPLYQTITLSELESHLWEAANILRGSPVDRTDWKSYILPLLFFKRICDVWDEVDSRLVHFGHELSDVAAGAPLPPPEDRRALSEG